MSEQEELCIEARELLFEKVGRGDEQIEDWVKRAQSFFQWPIIEPIDPETVRDITHKSGGCPHSGA